MNMHQSNMAIGVDGSVATAASEAQTSQALVPVQGSAETAFRQPLAGDVRRDACER